jgi:predicted hotdog family 3-hydroxylacyl-ACP dehydratase
MTRSDEGASIFDTAYADGFPSVDTLLPHRGTMKLLEQVESFSELTLMASTQVDGTAWYADAEGAMPVWIGLELMAQAIAAHVALRLRLEHRPAQPGVLLGARRYDVFTQAFACDARLYIDVCETIKVDGGHGAYDCEIRSGSGRADDGSDSGSTRLARAVVKVYQPDNFQQFIKGSVHS